MIEGSFALLGSDVRHIYIPDVYTTSSTIAEHGRLSKLIRID